MCLRVRVPGRPASWRRWIGHPDTNADGDLNQVAMINVMTLSAETKHPVVRDAAGEEIGTTFPGVPASAISMGLLLDAGDRGALAFGPEPFDSAVFGLRIGRIVSASAQSAAGYRSLLAEVTRRARTEGYDQILCRTGLDNLAQVWALERAGFELMDAGVTFARSLTGAVQAPVYEDLLVRPSTDDDIERIVVAMVGQPWGSRYESDPAYDPARVAELRKRWLWNSQRGRADVILVGVLDGQPAGYGTCRLDAGSGHGEIELVGTLPEFRGRRVASRVLAHAVAWFSTRASLVTVRTQATNIAAANLYESGGFTLRSSDLTFRLSIDRRNEGMS
jgi:ribosomal protein S18 acetylase RimI-like enzyme